MFKYVVYFRDNIQYFAEKSLENNNTEIAKSYFIVAISCTLYFINIIIIIII